MSIVCLRGRFLSYAALLLLGIGGGCADNPDPPPTVPVAAADSDAAILQRLDTEERARLVGQRWPRLVEGMTRAQVEVIIGPPDQDRKDLMGADGGSKTAYPVYYFAYLTPGPGDKFDGAKQQVIAVTYDSAFAGDRYMGFKVTGLEDCG